MIAAHPAKYTDKLIPLFASLLEGTENVLDPCAGTGKLAHIWDRGYKGRIYLNELEPEWAFQADERCYVTIGDARKMPYRDGFFDAICSSFTYGTRMADKHVARDKSRRLTYTHTLGRQLTEGNTGGMNWGVKYRTTHVLILAECRRVLKPGRRLILNISNHIRKGEEIPVTDWFINAATMLGFSLEEHHKIETPRLRYGANREKRVPYESVLVFGRGA